MYRYVADENTRLVVATFEGNVTDADLFEYLANMLANTKYRAGWHSLIDLTGVDVMGMTTAGIQRMRALPLYMEERLHGARAAVLVSKGSAAYDMARLYESMGKSSSYEVALFTDRETAMHWLMSE
ncbi:MAG TPA: hypothetical protein VGK20_11510 [Candidatus Binatia bacterium]